MPSLTKYQICAIVYTPSIFSACFLYANLFACVYELRCIKFFPKQCSHCRGSGGDSGTGRLVCRRIARLRRSIFVRRRGTSCMLPRSRAGETLGRATFFRKTKWFQHTFCLNSESGPGGLRETSDASRGLLGAPPGLPGGVPKGPSGILLLGFFLQVSSSEIPPQGILLGDSSSRIPPPGFHL